MPQNDGTIVIEDARLLFRNFAGEKRKYNESGKRNFAVAIDDSLAKQLEEDGWNVKWLEPREGDEDEEDLGRQAILQVKVDYEKGRPPKVAMITSRGRTNLTEDMISMLDVADIINVDLIIRPYPWHIEATGKSGIAAYLKSLFVTIEEDELEKKYAELEQQ